MNAANRQSTRWLTLIGTIITQFALGSVYTWSLFNSSLSDKLGEPVSQVAFSFGLLSLGLALSSSVAGKLQERFGVKRGRAGGAGGRRRLPADPVELREMVPGT